MKPRSHDLSTRYPSLLRNSYILASSIAMIATSGMSHAAINTWKVAVGDWAATANWTAPPASTDDAVFSDPAVGGSPVTASLGGNKVVNTLTFQSTSTTLINAASNRNLDIAAGLTVNSDAGAVTISIATNSSGTRITTDQTWTNDGTLAITNTVKPLTGPNTLTLTGTGVTTISGNITDNGAGVNLTLNKNGAGTLNLSGASNTFAGLFSINAGVVSVGTVASSATGTQPLGKNATLHLGSAATAGTLQYTGGTATLGKGITLGTDGTGAFDVTGSGTTLTLTGAIDGGGGLKKMGSGALVLSSSSNSFGGVTEIAEGTLRVNGNVGAVSIATAGTLGGSGGTVGGAVSMMSGSTVAPGSATTIGTLNTTGNVEFAAGAVFDTDINTDGSTSDLLIVNGDLSLAGATLAAQNLGAGAPDSFEVFTIVICTGTLTGTFNGLAEGAVVPIGGRNFTISYEGGSVSLIAPEVIGSPYDAWAAANITAIDPAADATAGGDPDKDGVSNLSEFAFGGDPLSGSAPGKVFVLTADTDADTSKELILTIAVLADAPAFSGPPSPSSTVDGITYLIQGSADLSAFTAPVVGIAPVTTDLPPAGTGYEYRSFRLTESNGLPGKGFIRAIAQY